jgi:membrane-bound ClpP family serine protease
LRAQQSQPATGIEGLVGQLGPVKSDLKTIGGGAVFYQGVVLVNGELWKATSDEVIREGEQVVVKSVDGLTLHVKKASA